MKKLVDVTDACGLEALLGEKVLLMCSAYFYTGVLSGVNETFVELTDPAIVYETGEWGAKVYQNVQSLCQKTWYIQRDAIESFGKSK